MVTDPIADLLVRLKNASSVGHAKVELPYSRMKHAVAQALYKEGYVAGVSKKGYSLVIELSYTAAQAGKASRPTITGAKRISKPSRRMYLGVRDVKPVKRGLGLILLSTPKGIMTGKEAKAARVGGEALFEIW